MKTNKAIVMTILIAGIIGSAYGMGQLEEIGGKAKKANETVRKVNEVIRDTDEAVEGVGGAKEGVKDIAKDSGEVVGIDPGRPAPSVEPAEPAPVTVAQAVGTDGIVGIWEYKSRFSPSWFEFAADTYAYYRGRSSEN